MTLHKSRITSLLSLVLLAGFWQIHAQQLQQPPRPAAASPLVYSGPNIAYSGTPQEITNSLSNSKWDFYIYMAIGGVEGLPPNYPTPDQYLGDPAKSAQFAMTDAGYLDFSSASAFTARGPWSTRHMTVRFACVQRENPPKSPLFTSALVAPSWKSLWKWSFQAVPTEPRLDTYGITPTTYGSTRRIEPCLLENVPPPDLADASRGALDNDKLYKITGEFFWAYSGPNGPGFPSGGADLNSQHINGYPVVNMVFQGDAAPGNDVGRFYGYSTLSGRMVSANRIEGFFTASDGIVGGFVMTRCPATGCKTKP